MCHKRKTPLVRKATGNHLMKSTSLETLRALFLVSATLEFEHATQVYGSSELLPIVVSNIILLTNTCGIDA